MQISSEKNASDQYFKLRDEYLTPKYTLENYGVTSIIFGCGMLTLGIRGIRRLKMPKTKIGLVFVGIVTALLSDIAYVFDLITEQIRGSFPPWADSIGIVLMGFPFLIMISLVWVGLNLLGVSPEFKTGLEILPIRLKNANGWYATMLILTSIIVVWIISIGFFWQIVPGILWIYFYLCLMTGIMHSKTKVAASASIL